MRENSSIARRSCGVIRSGIRGDRISRGQEVEVLYRNSRSFRSGPLSRQDGDQHVIGDQDDEGAS